MKLTILGRGTAFPRTDAGSAGYLLDLDGKKMLFDTGLGTLHKLAKRGTDVREVHHIFYSHLHNDHTCELPPLLWFFFVAQKQRPDEQTNKEISLTLYGPEGLKDYVDLIWHRVLGREEPCEFIKDVIELKSGTFNIDNMKIMTEPVVHMSPAIAFRVEHKDKSFVYSGDLERCEGIEKLAKGADLLLLECAFPKDQEIAKHMNTTQCGKLAKESKVKKLVLTHMYPQALTIDVAAEAAEQFDGNIIKAEDLMGIDI